MKYEGSKNNLDYFMVIPFCAPVAHLIDQGLKPVVHRLWLLSLVEDESTELPLDRLPLGDLGSPFFFLFAAPPGRIQKLYYQIVQIRP